MKKNNFPGYINIMLIQRVFIPYPSKMDGFIPKNKKELQEYFEK